MCRGRHRKAFRKLPLLFPPYCPPFRVPVDAISKQMSSTSSQRKCVWVQDRFPTMTANHAKWCIAPGPQFKRPVCNTHQIATYSTCQWGSRSWHGETCTEDSNSSPAVPLATDLSLAHIRSDAINRSIKQPLQKSSLYTRKRLSLEMDNCTVGEQTRLKDKGGKKKWRKEERSPVLVKAASRWTGWWKSQW